MSDTFERTVLADFFDEHRAGRTPNPCVRCNEHIKFGAFLRRADALGFDFVATGHYVRTWSDEAGRWHLGRGLDRSKDQSYVLHVLGQAQLARSLFPVGGQTKAETRAHAQRLGLPVAGKPDSQEVCFVPGADHAAFLERHAPDLVRPGEVVEAATGSVLGVTRGPSVTRSGSGGAWACRPASGTTWWTWSPRRTGSWSARPSCWLAAA